MRIFYKQRVPKSAKVRRLTVRIIAAFSLNSLTATKKQC
nr:MAG TPA: hypothetical protein [Caudoviricetes sp.]